MGDSPYPDWVYAIQTTHIGCEICQQVCPRNRKLGFIAPDAELLSAFDLERLLSGDTAEARKLVGRNITGGDKLRIEAESFKRRGAR